MNLIGQAKGALAGVRIHWNVPPEGYSVPYKEVAGLSIGKFGYYMAIALAQQITLTGSNIIISQALHVDPVHINMMNIVSTIVCFWFTLIRSHWVDNAHSREGRFRPFMRVYGIPSLALAAAVVWFPFHLLPNGGEAISGTQWGTGYWMKVVILLALFLGLQFFQPIHAMAFDNIVLVMSPNSQERLNIQAISSFVWSLAPSLYDIFFSLISGKFTNSLADIRLYRYAYIPVSVLGLMISYVGYFTTKERVLQSRAHFNRMTLLETFRAVSKNKNFWMLCASQWAGFLEGNSNDLLRWTYVYQQRMTPAQYTFADMFVRFAATATFAVTPPAAKRFGKRKLLIGCNLLNIALLAVTYKTFHIIPALVAFRFVNYFFNIVLQNIQPALDADVRDAQHYISGERIDGMFSMVGYVGSLIGMGTGFVTPFLWRRGGIYEGNGALDFEGNKSMWFALRDTNTFNRISRTMIATSVAGAVMNVIPLFFYDLTETKQRGMSRALKLRAMFEDYANGILAPELRGECAAFIQEAQDGTGDAEENSFVLAELAKYGAPEMRPRLALAREIANGGYGAILNFDSARYENAKKILRKTRGDKAMMKAEVEVLREMRDAQRCMVRFFPAANPAEPDIRELDALYAHQPQTRREAKELRGQIQALEQQRVLFHRSAKPYIKAKRLLEEQENAGRLEEIFAQEVA